MDVITYALLKKKISSVAGGISGYEVDGLNLKITTSDGQVLTMTFPEPKDGVSITDIDINEQNHLLCTMSDGTEIDAGEIKTVQGPKGDPGESGVYLGTEEPQDENIKVWINPEDSSVATLVTAEYVNEQIQKAIGAIDIELATLTTPEEVG